jgi:hypothetical protein
MSSKKIHQKDARSKCPRVDKVVKKVPKSHRDIENNKEVGTCRNLRLKKITNCLIMTLDTSIGRDPFIFISGGLIMLEVEIPCKMHKTIQSPIAK